MKQTIASAIFGLALVFAFSAEAADPASTNASPAAEKIKTLLEKAAKGRMSEVFVAEYCSGSKAASADALKRMKQDAIRDYEALLAIPEFKAEAAKGGALSRSAEAAIDLAELYADAGQADKASALLAETLKAPQHRNTLLRGYTALANVAALRNDKAGVIKAYRELLGKVPPDTAFGRHDGFRNYMDLAKLALNYLEGCELDALQLPRYTGARAYPTPQDARYSNDFVPLKSVKIEGIDAGSPLYKLIAVKFKRYGIEVGPKGAFTIKVNTADAPVAPEKPQAYALKVTKEGAVIRGADKSGAVWGVVSLIQLIDPAKKAIRLCEINDWPVTLRRGHSGSFASQVEYSLFSKENFIANQNGVLFPNDARDYACPALHRMIAAAEAKAFTDFGLELAYLERRVMWWGMSLDNENVFRMERDLGAFFASIGVSHGIAFDDTRYPGSADDLKKHGMLRAELDAKFMARLDREVKAVHPNYRLIFCPPFYWGPDARGMQFTDQERETYLGAFGTHTDPGVGIWWSGGAVLARTVRPDQVEWFRKLTKRNPTLWQNRTGNHESLNYIADETPLDEWYYKGMVQNDVAAVMKNAGMPGEGTQCYVFANYLWNPAAYDRAAALKSAMDLLFGQGIYELLKPGADALAYFDRYLLDIQPSILKENVQDLEAKIKLARDMWDKAYAISGKALDTFPAYYRLGISRAEGVLKAAKNPPDFNALYKKYAKEVAQTEGEAAKFAGYSKAKGDILITAPGIFGGRGVSVNNHSMYNGDNRLGTPLYGAQTPYAKGSCEFTLDPIKGDVEILVSASDDERADKCLVRISVNGETLYEGADAFPDKAYAVKSVVAPRKLLRKDNTIVVENLSPGDNPRGVPWIYVNFIVVRQK